MAYVRKIAEQKGQQGPIPMVYHGTARAGNPLLIKAVDFHCTSRICWYEYGQWAAYYYIIKGMIQPYLSLPYRTFEWTHASELQYYYTWQAC